MIIVYGKNKAIGTPFSSLIRAILYAKHMKRKTGYKWHITTYKRFNRRKTMGEVNV